MVLQRQRGLPRIAGDWLAIHLLGTGQAETTS